MTRYLPLIFLLVVSSYVFGKGGVDYVLKTDDTVKMTVFQEEELTTEALIGKSGSVSFPLIGNVKLTGLTVKDAEVALKKLYEKDFLVSAQVNLSVIGYAEKWVIVGGDVNSPGTIRFPEDGALDLSGAIAQAGGVTELANTGNIVVRRKSGAKNTYSLAGAGGVMMQHGDNVTVGRSSLSLSTITIRGEVKSPGVVEFPKSGSLNILTALAKSGGMTRIANTKEVLVRRADVVYRINLRDINNGRVKMFYMKAGDILTVNESRF